jgi:methyl-accepting chemotaxis protein
MTNIKISLKLPIVIVCLVALATVVTGAILAFRAGETLKIAATDRLNAVEQARKSELAGYLRSIEGDLVVLADNQMVKQALKDFDFGWHGLEEPEKALKKLYITDNPNPTGSKEDLDAADDGSIYSKVHAQYHPWFRNLLRDRDYYDIFLFNPDGDLVYSVFKELDYATNLNKGKWASSDLGNAFRAARDHPKAGHVSFFDFNPHFPDEPFI